MEYQNLNTIDHRLLRYSIVIYSMSILSSFICGFYVNDYICNININTNNSTIY